MSLSPDLSTFSALPIEFVHNGKTYTVSLLKQPAKAKFERWAKQKAWQALEESKDFLSPDEIKERKNLLLERQAIGYYGYHSAYCQEAQRTFDGAVAMAAILFGCSEEEMLEIAVSRTEDIKNLLARIMQESVPNALKAKEDGPNV